MPLISWGERKYNAQTIIIHARYRDADRAYGLRRQKGEWHRQERTGAGIGACQQDDREREKANIYSRADAAG